MKNQKLGENKSLKIPLIKICFTREEHIKNILMMSYVLYQYS